MRPSWIGSGGIVSVWPTTLFDYPQELMMLRNVNVICDPILKETSDDEVS
jgi:hypothetical protein